MSLAKAGLPGQSAASMQLGTCDGDSLALHCICCLQTLQLFRNVVCTQAFEICCCMCVQSCSLRKLRQHGHPLVCMVGHRGRIMLARA